MAKSTYSKYTKKSPLTQEDKNNLIVEGEKKVEDFLSERKDILIKSMEDEIKKGKNPWDAPVFTKRYSNPASGTLYGIENTIILSILSINKNYENPYYLTAKQGFELGLSNKGEKGDFIVHRFGMNFGAVLEKNEQTGKNEPKKDELGNVEYIYKKACKLSSVFNLDQFTGELPDKIKNFIKRESPQFSTNEEVSVILNSLIETMPSKLERDSHGKNNYYIPATDTVTIAESKHFKSKLHELYTLLHEVSHSYGHESRKNRESLAKYGEDLIYRGTEELVANLSAQAVMKHFDLKLTDEQKNDVTEAFFNNHANYDSIWLKRLNKEHSMLFKAINDADRTANEIIFKLENNLKLKYEKNAELEVSDFLKERLTSKVDNDEEVSNNKSRNKIKPK